MKILIPLFLLVNLMFASAIKVGDNLASLQIKDQFDTVVQITNDTKKLIVVFSKDKGSELKEFFEANPNYLKSNNAVYFADVSAAPSFVTNLFMIPKFKKYPYSMGLIRESEVAEKFPKQNEEILTIITLDNSIVSSITYEKSLK